MGAVWPLRLLLGASLLRMLVTVLSGILFVGQGLKALARIHGTVAVIGLAGSLLVVRRWGITGVAVALLAAWTVGIVQLHHWFRRLNLGHWSRGQRSLLSKVVVGDRRRRARGAGAGNGFLLQLLWFNRMGDRRLHRLGHLLRNLQRRGLLLLAEGVRHKAGQRGDADRREDGH